MKAVVYTQYGDPEVLRITEVDKPQPQENELLVRVRAVNINFGDLFARKMGDVRPSDMYMPWLFWLMARWDFGWRKPKRFLLGSEFAGEVEAVGAGVTRFAPGDRVFGYLGQKMGGTVEYLCIPEDAQVARQPQGMDHQHAAALPYGAMTALGILRKVQIGHGSKVLVVGASGSIGAAALQLAKAQGAEVTAVCGTNRIEMVKQLGADHAIDYTRQSYLTGASTSDLTGGAKYDVVFDVLGIHTFKQVRPILTPKGAYLLASFKSDDLIWMLRTRKSDGQKVICAFGDYSQESLAEVKALVESGALTTFVDRAFPFEEAAAAHRYMESGSRRGAVVLTMESSSSASSPSASATRSVQPAASAIPSAA